MAQLDERLPLERSSLTFGAVILADLIERVGEGPLAAVGPQSDVDVKMPSCLASIHCKNSCARRSKYSLFSIPCLPLVRPGPP